MKHSPWMIIGGMILLAGASACSSPGRLALPLPAEIPADLRISLHIVTMRDDSGYMIDAENTVQSHGLDSRFARAPDSGPETMLFVAASDKVAFTQLASALRALNLERVRTIRNTNISAQAGGISLSLSWGNQSIYINDSGPSFVAPQFSRQYSEARRLIMEFVNQARQATAIPVTLDCMGLQPLERLRLTIKSRRAANASLILELPAQNGSCILLGPGEYQLSGPVENTDLDALEQAELSGKLPPPGPFLDQTVLITETTKALAISVDQNGMLIKTVE